MSARTLNKDATTQSSTDVLSIVRERGCYVFGTGFVASMLVEALRAHDALGSVMGYLVSECNAACTFEGAEVYAATDAAVDRAAVVLVAVHGATFAEADKLLGRLGYENVIWAYPHLYNLLYGEPLYRHVKLETRHVLSAQNPSYNWLAVRALAAEALQGSRPDQREVALDAYVKAMALHCGTETARKRLSALGNLLSSMEVEGFNPDAPVLLDTELRIIDGLHRVAVAWLLGEERISCEIVKASPVFDRVLTERNKLTDGLLAQAGLSEEQLALVHAMSDRMNCRKARPEINVIMAASNVENYIDQSLESVVAQTIEEPVFEMPEVSVIIPVYNVEEWLPACLDSVLAQTLEDIEVICVDDCSPDGCAEILADYALRDSRVRIITLDCNSGQGVARNVGFATSRGRYAYFLDSDDMVAPKALEELVARADADELDGIFFDSEVVYDSPELAKRYQSYPAVHKGTYPTGVMGGLELFEAFMAQRDWTCYVQRQLWRSEYLRERGISFPTWASHEDEAFAFEALVAASRAAFVPIPYFMRRYRVGSVMTTKPMLKNFASYFQGLSHMARFMYENGLESAAADRNLARIYDTLVRQHKQLLADGVDVASRFEGTELMDAYLLFVKVQKAHLHHGLLGPKTQQEIERAERIFIYGAGVIAGNVFESLVNQGRAVEGFLVSSAEDNPEAFKGHHVRAIGKVPADSEALVVIAVTDGYRADVEELLDGAGWHHVYSKE